MFGSGRMYSIQLEHNLHSLDKISPSPLLEDEVEEFRQQQGERGGGDKLLSIQETILNKHYWTALMKDSELDGTSWSEYANSFTNGKDPDGMRKRVLWSRIFRSTTSSTTRLSLSTRDFLFQRLLGVTGNHPNNENHISINNKFRKTSDEQESGPTAFV